MEVFRLQRAGLDPSSGAGAAQAGGRWNQKGLPVVYCAELRALSVLECVVHLVRLPVNYWLTIIKIPEGVEIESVDPRLLPQGWRGEETLSATRQIGSDWLSSARTAVLRVPSVVIPEEHNYLLNPRHSAYRHIVFREPEPFRFDARLRPARSPTGT